MVSIALGALLIDGCAGFGQRAHGARLVRMQHSPEWSHGHFVNPQPLHNDIWGSIRTMFHASPDTSPRTPIVLLPVDATRLATPPASGLRVTWLGHSTQLIEIDGVRILTDPLFSNRASPYSWVGPSRWYPPPIPLASLPPIDAVVISHDHYDHLDYRTLSAMKDWPTTFIVPLGVGAHLAHWGVPEGRIIELDWWQQTKVGNIDIHCLPARHASGRTLFDKDKTLWAGYALLGPQHRAYYSGDSGLFPALRRIGAQFGPFDVTMIEIGQYDQAWPDWHMGPEQAVKAHQLVRGRVFIPVHWGLLTLAAHGWTEPIERALAEAARLGVTLATAPPGQSIEPTVAAQAVAVRWWPALPFRTGTQDPIVSTQMN